MNLHIQLHNNKKNQCLRNNIYFLKNFPLMIHSLELVDRTLFVSIHLELHSKEGGFSLHLDLKDLGKTTLKNTGQK
ncbi:hypothetical protein SAMN03080598_03313 [Algoriphagus boritolerans DSM 17298 = JCM 18970]|uniref:Uncharacterized protein n=1 Tax=Algoriphagus boritolerans DSM 17298 = JCM 18970 TaxID=1120964 RepID=A0A1H5Z5R1_9BACT|nr:hypothetical protein SAMN03080598_03313 [Algoriphagus boritolerans DSM 17298 = JCM 18970]